MLLNALSTPIPFGIRNGIKWTPGKCVLKFRLPEILTRTSSLPWSFKEEDKLKKTTSRSLAPISNKLQELVKECKAGCGPGTFINQSTTISIN